MAKDALTVLREARELISDPKRWTQETYAKAADGRTVGSCDGDAVCFCAIGAIHKVSHLAGVPAYLSKCLLADAAEKVFGTEVVPFVNDKLGYEATLRMFDAAIASAEKEAGNAVQA